MTIKEKVFATEGGLMRPVLRDVAFKADGSEVLVLLGPSGIGKTTVLRIILGLDPRFDGRVNRPSGRIGTVFQEPRLLPWLSVEENLRLVRPDGLSDRDVATLLENVELPGVQRQLPASLSLGMARRVAVARALAVDPMLLVMDEPFASLDAGVASSLGNLLVQRAKTRGLLALLSTHDAALALSIATRVLVIAGTPAGLQADVRVPASSDPTMLRQLHGELMSRFAFLAVERG